MFCIRLFVALTGRLVNSKTGQLLFQAFSLLKILGIFALLYGKKISNSFQ